MKTKNNVLKGSIPVTIKILANGFVQRLFDLYDKAYMPKESDFEERIEKVYWDNPMEEPVWYSLGFRPKKTVVINKGLEEAYQNALSTLIQDPNDLSIEIIEDFCDFVRIAEKIAFFENDTDAPIIVDSSVEDSMKRLVIKNPSYTISIKTYSSKPSDGKENDTISISVERLYGKQMSNSFVVVNREISYNDDSDMYLMNTINLILMNQINGTLKEVYDIVKEKRIKGTW